MQSRLKLQLKLEELTKQVYFQPPASCRISYPCIIYKLADIEPRYADDNPYNLDRAYQITYIDIDPDSEVPLKLAAMNRSRFNNYFVSDNLNHWVFTIFN